MPPRSIALAFLLAAGQLAYCQDRLISGKVVMEDGSPPPKSARIERSCGGRVPVHVASANAKGEFSWTEAGAAWSVNECIWRAVLAGYESTVLDAGTLQNSARVPDFVLYRQGENVPPEAATRWNRAAQAMNSQRWTDAETDLRALSAQFPQTAPIWTQLGQALARQERLPEARQAYQRAIQAVPWYLPSYHLLAVLDLDAGDYEAASKTVEAGLKKGSSALLYLDQAEIRYNRHDASAEHSALQAIALDTKHELPRAEYVLGLILSAGEDKLSAVAHLRRFLGAAPNAPEAESARARLRALEAGAQEVVEEPIAPETASANPDLELDANGEVGIPGGLRGLAAAARMNRRPAPKDFFLEYCRTVAAEAENPGRSGVSGFTQAVQAYLSAVLELEGHAARPDFVHFDAPVLSALANLQRNTGEAASPRESKQIVLSTDTAENYSATGDVLKLFGWRPSPKGVAGFEPSELAQDSARQLVPMALGIDETEMFRSLSDGGAFRIEIRDGRAPLVEARAWRSLMGKLPPGGFAEAFLRNPRFALTYVGLASMNGEAAASVIGGIGLRALVARYAEPIATFGEAFAVERGRAAVPGGTAAEPVWQRLAGASPADPKAFFRALLDKDQGRLAVFYWAVWRGDEAHRRFFTSDSGVAQRFYDWYRNSPELRDRVSQARAGWRQELFRNLPLDEAGKLYFPGGKAVWMDAARPEDEALPAAPALEALAPVAALERARKAPLDAESARLLAGHYSSWRSLFPYFEELPALGAAEFQALAAFETSTSARPAAAQNAVMGEWHSLLKLIELGTRSGSLDSAAGGRAFRATCESLAAPDHAAGAMAALRSFASGANDLEEAVRNGVLRLTGERGEAYRQVREIQGTPSLSTPGLAGRAVLAALSGAVYAALLHPLDLLVMEVRDLPARHKFTLGMRGPVIFAPTNIVLQHEDPGSYFAGGFMTFEEAAKGLARADALKPTAGTELTAAASAPTPPAAAPVAAPPPAETSYVFRANARLVEISATVMDTFGHYVDDLKAEDFRVVDAGAAVEIAAFENHAAGVSVALLLDTTGSMFSTLPALRSSALRLIEDLRPVDWVGIYGFNSAVAELQPFTRNRNLAKRAILRTHAAGSTAMYDALVRVAHDLSGRPGKKAIVVFTDGEDNASALTAEIAINRAKRDGVPLYTIAQGGGVADARTGELSGMSDTTGGLSFAIRNPDEIRGVFEHISRDLLHGYLLTFQPPPDTLHKWRPLKVSLPKIENRLVRARQGYYPD
jgi:Ca-activated chloride channel family protein